MPEILLTNDDGIDAPGLAALHAALSHVGDPLVVAPSGPQSGVGHAVTTRSPLIVEEQSPGWVSVSGTPADCSRVALRDLCPEAKWLFSGINPGGNLGVDAYTSGTLAAAREAAFLGCRAVAFSQYLHPERQLDWEWAAAQCRRVFSALVDRLPSESVYCNVNLPHLPPDRVSPGSADPDIVFCDVDHQPHDVRFNRGDDGKTFLYSGDYSARSRVAGADVDVCFNGSIAVSVFKLSR